MNCGPLSRETLEAALCDTRPREITFTHTARPGRPWSRHKRRTFKREFPRLWAARRKVRRSARQRLHHNLRRLRQGLAPLVPSVVETLRVTLYKAAIAAHETGKDLYTMSLSLRALAVAP